MVIFDETEAQYYCQNYNSTYGVLTESINDYYQRSLTTSQNLQEGTNKFDEFRCYLMREVERNLFLSAASFNISHRLMSSGFSSWNYITLYYGAFFSARALLGMFGVYLKTPSIAIDVSTGNVGNQSLRIRRNRQLRNISTATGSHQMFWDFFYQAISPLHTYITDAKLRFALYPISSDPYWQICNRNDINYDTIKALNIIHNFETNFEKSQFPSSLPGALNTQFLITEALTLIAFQYAKKFNIKTDALSFLSGRKERQDKIKRFIFKPSRGTTVDIKKKNLIIS